MADNTVVEFVKKMIGKYDILSKIGIADASVGPEDYNRFVAFTALAQTVEDETKDGLQLSDLPKIFGKAVGALMAIAESSKVDGTDKKVFVVSMAKEVYRLIDKGVAGDKNRINIPFIPEPWETRIEMKILDLVVGFGVETACKYIKKD